MNTAAAANTIIQAFKTWFATNYAAVPLCVPDVDFTVPDSPGKWARISIQWGGRQAAGAGRAEDRHTGLIFVELFWPSGQGYKDANEAAEAVATWFRNFTADGGRLQCKGITDGARPWINHPPSEAGMTRRTINAPLRLMEAL